MHKLHAFLFFLLLFSSSMTTAQAGDRVKRILQVESYSSIDPWTLDSASGFRDALNGAGIEVNYEIFSFAVRFQAGMKPREADVRALQTKLDSGGYDLVVAYNNSAADLFLDGRLRLPQGTPLLLNTYHGEPAAELQRKLNMTALISPFHPYESTRFGLHLLPGLEKVVLVIDATADGQKQRELIGKADAGIAGQLTIIDGAEYSTAELLEKAASLSSGTLLVFHSWGSARDRNPGNSYTMLPRLRKIFPGLILGRYDSYMPLGSSGGVVAIGREQGRQAGAMAARILNGERAAAIPYEKGHTHTRLDYQAIRQFHISRSRIPAGTEIVNSPPDFLTRHRVELAMGAGFLILCLAGYIFALLHRRHEQRKATMLFKDLPVRVFIIDRQERILFAHIPNPVSGMLDDSLTRLEQLASPDAVERIRSALRKAFGKTEKISLDHDICGHSLHDEFLRLPARNPFRKDVVMCVSTDVTELHAAHRETALLAERFRLTLESIGDGVITTDRSESVVLMNPVAAKLTGYSPDEAAGKAMNEIFRIISYVDEKPVPSPLRQAIATGKNVELANHTDLIAKDGSRRHIADCASPIRDENGGIIGGVLIFRDVTEEYKKRDQLRMNSVILKTVAELADISYFRSTPEGEVRLPVAEDYWPRRNGLPIGAAEWVAGEDLDNFVGEWRKLRSGESDQIAIAFAAGKPKRYFELRAIRSTDEISGRQEIFGVIQDVSRSRESERQARTNLQLLQNIMDNLPGCVFIKDADNDFSYVMCNRKFGEMTGFSVEQVPGRLDREIFPLDEAAVQKFRENDRAVIESGEKLNIREQFLTVDGQTMFVQTLKTAMDKFDGGKYVLGISIDVSREYELEQAQKRMIESLDYATRCERIINQSLSMITLEPDFDKAVNEMLRIIGENADADRAYIFLFTSDGCRYASNEYEWVRSGVSPQKQNLQQADMAAFPQWMTLLRAKKEILVLDTDHPPDELEAELKFLKPQGIKSLLVSGIWQDGKLLGFVGLDYIRKSHAFSDTSVHTVRSIANLFLLARERTAQLDRIADTASMQRQIVDNISIPLFMFDLDYNIVMANTATCEGAHRPMAELIGEKCYRVSCGCDSPPDFCPFEKVKLTKQPVQFDFKNPNGHTYMISFQPLFNRNGEVINLLETAVDVTELYRQKDDLRRAMEQAQAADRAKSYFLATMSHELRTPLNAVIGFSELLQSDDINRKDQLDYLHSITWAGSALLNLINDVLDLSKLEAEQMNIAPVQTDMAALAEEGVAVFQLKCKQKNITLSIRTAGLDGPVFVDHLRIRQILLNLIGNAVKFTHEGSVAVTVEYHVSGSDTGELNIQVADTGIGISEEQLKKIFDPFFQAENTRGNRVYEGSGLGLAISMRLVQRMGGTIDAASKPGGGSTFTVKLKNIRCELKNGSEAAAGDKTVSRPSPERQRVLLVDDVPMNLKVLQAMLRKLDVESVCTNSAAEALEHLRKDRNFKFILTDLWMPGMDGEQLALTVRGTPGLENLILVAVTADAESKENFNMNAFHQILLKPITLEKLQTLFKHNYPGKII